MTLKKQSILILIFSLSLTSIYAKDEVSKKEIVYSMKQGVSEVEKLLRKIYRSKYERYHLSPLSESI